MKYSIYFAFLFCWYTVKAQTTTYEINYSYDLGLGSSCNVFSAEKTINGFKHQTTKGFPNYIVNTQIGSHINLACKRNSSSSQSGTDYQILFPFKKNYKYQINVCYKSTYASGEFSPMIGLRMNATKKTHNTSVSCSGPQSIDFMEYEGQGSAGLSFAWPTAPLISTEALTQDYESLSIASFPLSAYQATQVQGIQVQTVRIVEIAPTPTIPNDEYTGAISLVPDASTPVDGTTYQATSTSHLQPSCISNPNRPDVWYKFQATSTKHTIKANNVKYHGISSSWAPQVGLTLYNSGLSEISCTLDRVISVTGLNIGHTYYVRFWDDDYTTQYAKDFEISVATLGDNAITGITTQYGFDWDRHKLTASFIHDPSIPIADITFDWEIVPPAPGEADYIGIDLIVGSPTNQSFVISEYGDVATRVRVRMKRISTNQPLSDWFITANLIWFG